MKLNDSDIVIVGKLCLQNSMGLTTGTRHNLYTKRASPSGFSFFMLFLAILIIGSRCSERRNCHSVGTPQSEQSGQSGPCHFLTFPSLLGNSEDPASHRPDPTSHELIPHCLRDNSCRANRARCQRLMSTPYSLRVLITVSYKRVMKEQF